MLINKIANVSFISLNLLLMNHFRTIFVTILSLSLLFSIEAHAGWSVNFSGKVVNINWTYHIVSTDWSWYDVKMCKIKTSTASFNSPTVLLVNGTKVTRLSGAYWLNKIPEWTTVYFIGWITWPYNSDTASCITKAYSMPVIQVL